MEGNVARAFARRWPDAWMEIEDEIKYPVPLGRAIAIHPENESGFPLVLIASTLRHLDTLSDSQKAGIVRSALSDSIQLAVRYRVRRVVVAAMTGGWRLDLPHALAAMVEGLRPIAAFNPSLVVAIHLLSQEHVRQAAVIARSLGIDVQIGADLK